MSNIIDFYIFKAQKEYKAISDKSKKDYPNHDDEEGFSQRMKRIRRSLENINNLMGDLNKDKT